MGLSSVLLGYRFFDIQRFHIVVSLTALFAVIMIMPSPSVFSKFTTPAITSLGNGHIIPSGRSPFVSSTRLVWDALPCYPIQLTLVLHGRYNSGDRTRTCNLPVMSRVSFPLLYAAMQDQDGQMCDLLMSVLTSLSHRDGVAVPALDMNYAACSAAITRSK